MRNWTLGLLTSLLIGYVVTSLFVFFMRFRLDRLRTERGITEPAPWHGVHDIPPWLMGGLERLFFTIAVAFNVPGAVTAMMAWLGLKMVTDWNRPGGVSRDPAEAMSGLLGGLVSMFFAMVGGLICKGSSP